MPATSPRRTAGNGFPVARWFQRMDRKIGGERGRGHRGRFAPPLLARVRDRQPPGSLEDDGHGGESLEEEARVMEEAGAVDGDSVAGDAEGDNAEHGGGHKHRLAEHAVEPDGGGPSAAPGSEGRERGERVGRAVPEQEQRGPAMVGGRLSRRAPIAA